MMLVHIMLES